MKRTFTKLMTAIALLLFITPPLVGWGQTYSLYSGQLVEGDYLIYYNGKAMNTTTNSNRLQYAEVTPANDVITTNLTNIVWHIAPDGDYWTIYNASEAKYAVSTGTKNQATTSPTLDDKARWTVSGTSTYEFVNKYNNDNNINKNLRNNGTYGFACYSTTTGGALSLYKLEESQGNTPSITANNVELAYDATESAIAYTINNPVEGGVLTAATDAEWLTIGTVGETVPFTCTMNDDGERMATVTLTYTYDTDQTVTKNVTVTQGNNPNAPGTENNPYTVAQARAAIDAGTGTQGVYATGIVSAIPTAYNSTYSNITFNMVDEEGDEVFLQAYRCGGDEAANVAIGDVVVVYGNLILYNNSLYEFSQDCQLVSLTHPVVIEPSITVTPNVLNVDAGEHLVNFLSLSYENIVVDDDNYFTVHYYNADGEEIEPVPGETWMIAGVAKPNDVYQVICTIIANQGEARTAYFKVSAQDADDNTVYSNLVTVNQEAYVAPTYAALPFEFNGGKAAIEETDGLYQEGLGSDYNASTNPTTILKFDGAGDWLLLQFQEQPGTLTFDIKGNGFSGGTFTVQTSEDGVTYEDLAEYTELGGTETMTFDNLGENVRYIKWIYTAKSSGNVGLGNISLIKYEAPQPAITLNSYSIEATAEETEGTLTVTYTEIVTDLEPEIYWFESDGVTAASEPDWMFAEINTDLNVEYLIEENEGEARTAYFKVYGVGTDESDVHSDLVTVSQAAAPQQYTLTVAPFENLELITFVNDEMVLESDGEIQVNEGDQIMLSVVADNGYVMETLMVNGVNHVNDIAYDFTYTFDMPAENVTIIATAVENVAPAAGYYVRITSLDQLTDGSKVIIAARYDEEHTNGYYAMPGQTSGQPVGVAFTSETSGNDEILPATITASEDTYYWTVNVTDDGYTFTNKENHKIGWSSSTSFATDGNNTAWAITRETAEETTMVPEYTGFVIRNVNTNTRAFAINSNNKFGSFSTTNIESSTYNFYLDFFVQSEAPETYTLDNITGYSGEKDHYYLIASPVTVDPANVEGMTTGDFDLYYFDQSQELEWINYRENPFNLVPGKGYLYAKKATQETSEYSFTLTGVPYDGNGEIELTNTTDADFEGWNLVGNPFGNAATISKAYYKLNEYGSEVKAVTETSEVVAVMEGVFVFTEEDGEIITFTEQTTPNNDIVVAQMNINVSKSRGESVDRAIVRFDNGNQLPKFQLNPNHTKVYIPQGNNDYAIVCSDAQGEMPVNFKAQSNGTYTISINAENVEMSYLHLIDNMTGADIDLLATPSYTFDANTTDYASRFRLVFNGNTVNENGNETFAYFNGSEWSISNIGRATLQVVDMLGRIVSNESVSGNATLSTDNLMSGIYMFRLVNGENVKVQKVVVK